MKWIISLSRFFPKKFYVNILFFNFEMFERKSYSLTEKDFYLDRVICSPLFFTVPREALKYRKNAVVWDPYFLIRHAAGITKIPIWKYFMRILARNFDISDLCNEKWPQIGLKEANGIFLYQWIAKNIHYAAFSDSVDTFRHKKLAWAFWG